MKSETKSEKLCNNILRVTHRLSKDGHIYRSGLNHNGKYEKEDQIDKIPDTNVSNTFGINFLDKASSMSKCDSKNKVQEQEDKCITKKSENYQ